MVHNNRTFLRQATMGMPRWKRPQWRKPERLEEKSTVLIVGAVLATLILGLFAFVIVPNPILKIAFVAVIALAARTARGKYFERTETRVMVKRQASLSNEPPRLKQRLRPYETTLTYWRKHPSALWFEGGIVWPLVVGTILGLIVAAKSHSLVGWLLMTIFMTFLALTVRAAFRYPEWSIRYYCATTHRMLMTRGLVSHSGPEVPLSKFLGREPVIPWHSHMLHSLGIIRELYGSFREETAGRSEEMGASLDYITYIPNVWFVYGQVTDMQYKGKDTNNANDDGT